jgi:GTP-binding protein
MRFIDEARIRVYSGKGGDGCSSMRREKFVPFGGPDGGNGGRGGDVILCASTRRNTLMDLRGQSIFKAADGVRGLGSQKTGARGKCMEILVPVGTRVFDAESGETLADLTEDQASVVIAPGGLGGLGNLAFKSSTNRTPRKFTEGRPGVALVLQLELMVMADIGLLGFPNAGKSTFISRVSAARPKVADYPFTTLVPNLGVVDIGTEGSYVIADIPGLIEGAAEGAGLGHRFLKHLSRTRILLHLVSMGPDELDPVDQRYLALRRELGRFDSDLESRQELVVLTKSDLVDEAAISEARDALIRAAGRDDIHVISSVGGEGIDRLKYLAWTTLCASTEDTE